MVIIWFVLFANAFLSVVYSVCVLAIYLQFAKSLIHPPTLFPFLVSHFFEWIVPSSYLSYFKSCSCPSNIRHHLPHYSSIMVLTRRSIITQSNRVSTRSCSSLVPVFFAFSKNNTTLIIPLIVRVGSTQCVRFLLSVSFFIYIYCKLSLLDYRPVWLPLIPPRLSLF